MPPIKWDNLFTYDTLVHATAGASGALTAMTVFFPLDTIRSRLQVEDGRKSEHILTMFQELVKEEGVGALYRGLGPVLTSICTSNFVYFYTFHGLRAVFSKPDKHTVMQDLALASLAGVVNVLSTTPLWVVNSRMKMQGAKLTEKDKEKMRRYPHYKGTIDGLIKIATTEGVPALWSGTLPSLALVSNPSIQFMVYEFMKRYAQSHLEAKELGGITIFLVGAMAKSIATVMTYPLQLLQSKLRYGSDELRKKTLLQMLAHIIQQQGFQGLYKGLEAKLMQTVMTAALMFLCYEKIVAFVFQILKGNKPKFPAK